MDTFVLELQAWEEALNARNMKRMFKTEKNYRCPRTEALRDFRNPSKTRYDRSGEEKVYVEITKRAFRHRMKVDISNEAYYRLTPHDYRTYGWLSW